MVEYGRIRWRWNTVEVEYGRGRIRWRWKTVEVENSRGGKRWRLVELRR